jgi:transposase
MMSALGGRGSFWRLEAELRYLPPYGPDLNPTEKAYSKLKAFLRKIANGPSRAC